MLLQNAYLKKIERICSQTLVKEYLLLIYVAKRIHKDSFSPKNLKGSCSSERMIFPASYLLTFITPAKRSCGKVMFYTCLSVILSSGSAQTGGRHPQARRQAPPPGGRPPRHMVNMRALSGCILVLSNFFYQLSKINWENLLSELYQTFACLGSFLKDIIHYISVSTFGMKICTMIIAFHWNLLVSIFVNFTSVNYLTRITRTLTKIHSMNKESCHQRLCTMFGNFLCNIC